ncbi:chorismate-binding protein [Muriicola sp. SD30]|uniref:chorismate-binding protein n=1 Tax=Muriicola sp. SD30 TaxID=3240936 RepID=UPI00350F1A71
MSEVKAHHQSSLPFVIFKYPHKKELKAILQSDTELNYTADFNHSGFVFSPFDDTQETILTRPDKTITAKLDTGIFLNDNSTTDYPLDDTEAVRYKKMVTEAVKAIQNKNLNKVVLSRSMEVATEKSAIDIFNELILEYPSAFCYCWYHPRVGCWMGATPEILLEVEGNRFTTVALAGTIEKSGDKKPNWTEKEKAEQQLVTGYIEEAMAGLGIEVKSSEVQTTDAGTLWHLKTTITGVVKVNQTAKMIRTLHPTPAVCGIPLKKARSYIRKHETYQRKFYTGYLGEIEVGPQQATRLFVNLRCMELREGKAIIYVGGGITQDSDPEKEWQETVAKSRTILKVL